MRFVSRSEPARHWSKQRTAPSDRPWISYLRPGLKSAAFAVVRTVGIDQGSATDHRRQTRQVEFDDVVVRVDNDEKSDVGGPPLDAAGLSSSIDQHPEATHIAVTPVLVLHLGARRVDPGDVFDVQLLVELGR